jgi:hypothetical protein
MGKTICASVLVLLFACSTQAGYMPNGEPEPPPPAHAVQEPMTGSATNTGTAESLTVITLELLAALPSLL